MHYKKSKYSILRNNDKKNIKKRTIYQRIANIEKNTDLILCYQFFKIIHF